MSAVVSSSSAVPSGAPAPLKQARGFPGSSLNKNPLLRHWLDLSRPGVIIIKVGKVDIGQGISTAQLQIAAEELDLAPAQVQRAPINTEDSPDEGVTSGSFSIEHSGEAVRRACATLRQIAVARFCQRHQVAAEAVSVADGVLSAGTARSSYWELQLQDVLGGAVDPGAPVKPPYLHAQAGARTARRDLAAKLFGKDSFIQDMVLKGMLHARLVRQSNRAARLLAVDEAAFAQRFPDVTLVRNGSFLGVLTEREEQAVAAAAHLHTLTRWDLPAVLPDSGNLRDFLLQTRAETLVVATRGEPADAAATVKMQHEAEYLKPYIAHASIGPSCAMRTTCPVASSRSARLWAASTLSSTTRTRRPVTATGAISASGSCDDDGCVRSMGRAGGAQGPKAGKRQGAHCPLICSSRAWPGRCKAQLRWCRRQSYGHAARRGLRACLRCRPTGWRGPCSSTRAACEVRAGPARLLSPAPRRPSRRAGGSHASGRRSAGAGR